MPTSTVPLNGTYKNFFKCRLRLCLHWLDIARAMAGMKEHTKTIAALDKNSLLAKRKMLQNHRIDLKNVEVVDRSSAWRKRLTLEVWLSMRDTNAISEHVPLQNVHKKH